jgi:tRNA A-37 threonylcarbamoyl transferase component Bud32
MVIVIDFDGTLALGDTGDIDSMLPNIKLVSLINQMYDDGNIIKIVTARGSKTCNTYEEKVAKYNNKISLWLQKYEIKYHILSFNKEYGDAYIDDKCYNIKNNIYYSKLDSRFTNNKVRRINDCVIKKSENSQQEVIWYNKALEIGLDVPMVLSYDLDTISTSFIDGRNCKNINLIINTLTKLKNTSPINSISFNSYIERISNYIKLNPNIIKGDQLIILLKKLNPPNTFNHGDFSTNNLIEDNNRLYLIDPIYSKDIFQSYFLDMAKHLFSVLYYDLDYVFYNQCKNEYITKLGIKEMDLDILIACESIRVANRKNSLIDISNNLIDILC